MVYVVGGVRLREGGMERQGGMLKGSVGGLPGPEIVGVELGCRCQPLLYKGFDVGGIGIWLCGV